MSMVRFYTGNVLYYVSVIKDLLQLWLCLGYALKFKENSFVLTFVCQFY
ncbi:MAG: hypothetical protein O4804_03080 [Trichodesmium sp. St11_bin5]|nr:hypothetical protein [Trichodesmium sp. St11_bin5]